MKRPVLKIIGILFLVGFLISVYPIFVLGYTWFHVANANLPGGRGGPLDAYRHTLASAIVAYTLDQRAVYWVSTVMERGNSSSNEMDKHNNEIGAKIGMLASSFSDIEPTVLSAIDCGIVNSDRADQITWLNHDQWQDSLFW